MMTLMKKNVAAMLAIGLSGIICPFAPSETVAGQDNGTRQFEHGTKEISMQTPLSASGGVPLSLAGGWTLCAKTTESSYCDGTVTTENMILAIFIEQNEEDLLLTIPGDQVLEGVTANGTIGAWSHTENQITTLAATLDGIDSFHGSITFSDHHDCPEAGAGTALFWAYRGQDSEEVCENHFDTDCDIDGLDLANFAWQYGSVCP